MGSIYGTLPGSYLVVGPDWRGAVPPGITGVFRCPTRYGYCLPRVFFTDSAADREAALPAISGIVAYPLSEYTGESQQCDWSKPRWLPNLASRGAASRGVSPDTFFDVLPTVLDDVPPLPGEGPLYARFRGLLAAAAADPAVATEIRQAAAEAERDEVAPLFEFRNLGRPLPAHWTTLVNGAAFGTDYRHALPLATGGKVAVGSRDSGLRYGADGSLTIIVSRDAVAAATAGDASSNRIVAPNGVFSLYLRIYWPDESALDGTWTPPPVHPVASSLQQAGT